MTQDELLSKMAEPAHNLNANDARNVYLLALHAVVKLAGEDIKHDSYVWLDGYDYAMKQIIQAIEKELND
jgi:hypothetical protein